MNKRSIVLIVGLVIIAIVLVLNGVVFTVKEADVDFDIESSFTVEEGLDERIISASGIRKGKNIFSVSESKIVSNIEASIPTVRVINVERRFPNKIIIHVSRRIPVYAIAYRQNLTTALRYVLVDGDMRVLDLVDSDIGPYTKVEGFSLIGRYGIEVGKTLSVDFGREIFYLQNIVTSFYTAGLTPNGFVEFIKAIRMENDIVYADTNSGVTITLGANLTTADISERIPKAYAWYTAQPEGSGELTKGTIWYDGEKFVYYYE